MKGTRLESLPKARLRDGVQVGERNNRNVTTVDREVPMLTRLSGCCSLPPLAQQPGYRKARLSVVPAWGLAHLFPGV